jgi:prepilin-type N-terminal cleavage/methylation domain-containing protein
LKYNTTTALQKKAFTLVEILVATAIFSLMILFLFTIISTSMKTWQDQQSHEESFQEARAALDLISRDVRSALVSNNVNWFYSGSNSIAFLTSLPANSQSTNLNRGDICAVGYSLEWGKVNQNDAQEKNRLSLYRYIRFSDPTYATIISGSNSVETVFNNPDGIDTVRDLLASNVTAISFNCYNVDSNGLLTTYTSSGTSAMPNIFDIMLTVLNGRTAAKLNSQTAWENQNALPIRQNSQTFYLHLRPQIP